MSRAAVAVPIDRGTRDGERHRLALCNGADPALAGSPLGILLANAFITPVQRAAGERYAALRTILFGPARPSVMHDWLEPYDPKLRSDGQLAKVRERFEDLIARLDREQRAALDNVVVNGALPVWFKALKLRHQLRPVDEADRMALIGALDALAVADGAR